MLERIGRGVFVLGELNHYKPDIPPYPKRLYKKLSQEFPYVKTVVWNTVILNEFMIHQPARYFTLVEVEKEVTQSVFYYLRDLKHEAYLEPDKEILEKYVSDNKETAIIKSLVTEAPLQKVDEILTVTLEKILVDLISDTITFSAFQGSERKTIFKEAFQKYTVNQDKMLRYARRRGKKEELIKYLNRLQLLAVNST